MPELPDLEVYARNLQKKIKGKKVQQVKVWRPKKVNVSEERLSKAVVGKKINRFFRNGKELWMGLENKELLGFHLMLKGQFHLLKEDEEQKYGVVEFSLEGGQRLFLADPRGMAKVNLAPEDSGAVDGLSEDLNEDFLKEKVADKRTTIKNFLLDQGIIKGIGNAYADEILWEARISPFSRCDKIPDEEIPKLSKSIKNTLTAAIDRLEKEHPGLIGGEERSFLKIHQKGKKESPGGAEILVKKTGSRKTYYTGEQKLYE